MGQFSASFPTLVHGEAAVAIVEFFQQAIETEAILLVNSCARGRATGNSCLDLIVYLTPEALARHGQRLRNQWLVFCETDRRFTGLRQVGCFDKVHLDIVDGQYAPGERTFEDGSDSFELEVGKHLAYSVILWERSDYVRRLRELWLPYYADQLRQDRLLKVQDACRHHLDHIPLYVQRELYFAAFDHLYKSFQLFLQALFIARRTYPMAYDKWIREQIEGILGLPELYRLLPGLLEVRPFESGVVAGRAEELRILLALYTEKTDTAGRDREN